MKKHFLLLVMALMSLTGWAADLDGSKFTIYNVTYSELVNPSVYDDATYTLNTDYTIELTKWYTDEACTALAKDGEGTPYTIDKLPVGKYWVKISGMGAYAGLTTSASFNVIAIATTISFTADQNKAWQADEPASYGYSLQKKGNAWTDAENDLGLTIGRATGENVGLYDYTFDWTNKNYALTRADANKFEITAKNLSATATITAAKTTMVYTGKNAAGIYTVKDGETTLVEGTDWSMADTKNVGGAYTPLITFKGNYTGTKYPETAFAITPAPITISIEDIEVTYNNTNQADQKANAKFTYSGIVGDDVATAADIKDLFTAPTSVAVASEAKNAGTYTLKISGGSSNTATNYAFVTYVDAKLTIKKAELKLKAADATKNLGDSDPAFALATPIENLNAAHSVTGVTYTRESGEGAGEYSITPDLSAAKVVVTGTDPLTDVTANYDLKVADTKGKLTIGKGAITVIVKDAEKAYGAADPAEFTYKTVGLAEGDEITVTITREKAGTTAGEAVGTYALTATAANPNAEKYSGVTIVDGVFAINRAKLTFAIPPQNIAIGKTEADLAALKNNITVTGINKADDTAASLYDLSFSGDVFVDGDGKTTNNQAVDGGLVATLTAAAQVNYEIAQGTTPETYLPTFAGKLIVGDGSGAWVDFAGDDTDYANNIQAYAGETLPYVSVTLKGRNARVIPAGTAHPWAKETWNTMVLPFEVSVADLSENLGYAIVNRVDADKTTEGNVVFKLEMQKIPANEPFCVKTAGAIPENWVIQFNDKKIVDGGLYPSVDAGQGYKFVGAYKSMTIDKTTPNFYFLRGDTPKWAHIGESSTNTWTVVSYDAYIDQSGSASARELTFTFQELDGSYTAIKSIEASKNSAAAQTGWYTIGGVKLQGVPAQKGVYINNGKKVIIK